MNWKAAGAVAALLMAHSANAAALHCVAGDMDNYWKIEGSEARFWENGQWSRNICADSPTNGFVCQIFPDRYIFTLY